MIEPWAQNALTTDAITKATDAARRKIQAGILEPLGLSPSCITTPLIWKRVPAVEVFPWGAGTRHA